MTLPPGITATLRAIVGDRNVLDQASALLAYESDALPGYRKRPGVAVFPGSRDEAIDVIRLLATHQVAFVPRGAGTGLSGGALADDVVLIGTNRMRRILAIDAEARTARVEPGVVNASLTVATTPHGLHYAPDPSSQSACTIGGNVAENAGGPHCLKYGATLNHILGATVVLPDGSVADLRIPRGMHDGYDLLGAFVGSEGCFGLAIDIDVRLMPNPEDIRTLLADFTSVDDAARATSAIIASGIVPAACELMDQGIILAVESSIYAAGYPKDAAAVLLVELDGSRAAVTDDAMRVEALCREHGARDVRVASDPADRARLWQGRKKAFGAMGRMAPHLAVQDAVVPRTKLAEILARISDIAARHGIRVCNVFHAGDGNLHPNIPYDGRNPDEADRVHTAMQEIMALCIASGGTITGEHGVGLDKLPYMDALFTPDTLDAMCRLRGAFDPDRRANPGKVVPVHSCREWSGAPAVRATPARDERNAAPASRVKPASSAAEQRIADAITHASETGARIFVSGAATRITPPPGSAQSISVSEQDNVIEYIPSDLTITVGAGMTLAELAAITSEHGQWCPLLPWGTNASTVGGTLATGQRGPASTALGAPRDLTLGMTFVDGRASVVRSGGRVVKNVAGFDLTRVLIGSWGSLGVITSASLRLRAIPPVRETWVVPVSSADRGALEMFLRGPYAPIACEQVAADIATSIGARSEPHVVVWLAGSLSHVAAARAALRTVGPVSETRSEIWTAIRARGSTANASPSPMADVIAALNRRVRHAFDPNGVFLSPMLAEMHVAAHA